jgi:general stress protein YciG
MVYEPTGKPRGFAAMIEMEPEAHREIARRGGLNARKNPNVHRFKAGSQEAINAGRRGGQVSKRTKST